MPHTTTFLLVVLFAKVIATGACVALRFYGGLFAPSLFIGAVSGAIFGNLLLATPLVEALDLESAIAAFPVSQPRCRKRTGRRPVCSRHYHFGDDAKL